MDNDLHRCTVSGDLERVKQLVEGGANIEETNGDGMTVLFLGTIHHHLEIVVYLVEHGANVAHTTNGGMSALHWACIVGNLSSVKNLSEHGARIAERDSRGMTALLYAALKRNCEVVQYLVSPEGGASITETDDEGNTALLLAAAGDCCPPMVQWLLEYGGAQITDADNGGGSVWSASRQSNSGLANTLINAYKKGRGGKYFSYGDKEALAAMLRVMVLHGGPPESLAKSWRHRSKRSCKTALLRARIPAYLAERRALLDAHCPLLPPLRDLVHGYEEPTTTDELWAIRPGAPLQCAKRPMPERGQSPERRSARLRQKRG
jgi:hypothetical protein